MTDAQTSPIKHLELPLDMLGEVAEHLVQREDAWRAVVKDALSCSLVSRDFAAKFQPVVFRRAHISDAAISSPQRGTSQRISKLLQILRSNPVLGTYVKRITVTLQDEGNDPQLPPLLDHLLSLSSLSLVALRFPGHPTQWSAFDEAFRSSVAKLCKLPTVQSLNLSHFNGLPASLFVLPRGLTTISLHGSYMEMDAECRSQPGVNRNDSHSLRPKFHLDISQMDPSYLVPLLATHKPFFSRMRSLKSAHTQNSDDHIETIILFCAQFRTLEHIDVTFEHDHRLNTLGTQRSLDLSPLEGLKSLKLRLAKPGMIPWHIFMEAVGSTIEFMDTWSLEEVVITVSEVELPYLSRICDMTSFGWGHLDQILASKSQLQELSKLQKVLVKIEVNRTEQAHHMPLMGPRELLRKTTFFPSLPGEMVRVVLTSKVGAVMYDSMPSS